MTRALPILTLVALLAAAGMARADEYDTLRLRWRDMLTQGTNSSDTDGLYSPWIVSLETSAGSYSSTLNTSANRTNLWSAYPNLAADSSDISGTYGRLRVMALACCVRGSMLKDNPTLRANIINGLDWMHANYYSPTGVVFDNWFDFEIASPLALNDIVVLLYSNLSPAQVSNYMGAVDHFAPTPNYSAISSNLTAANKIWKSVVVGVRGTIVKDSAKIDLARQGLSDVFPYVTTNDGFYADGSFIFHNYFPYNAGYGVELLDFTAQLLQLLQGSTWQITDPAQANVFRWVYDSYEPFIVRGAAMEMVDGRYHTRNGDGHERGHEMLGAVLRIAQAAPPTDAAAFKSFVKSQIQADGYRKFVAVQSPPYNVWAQEVLNDTNIAALADTTQHRQFSSMDRVVHRTPNWTFGLSMWSSRVANYESTRGENLKGWYTAEGMTYLYNSDLGHYSDNFWSTIDPYRLPGTTVDVGTRTNGSGESRRFSNPQSVGGASILGLYGVAAMHMNAWNSTLSARKSWFMFDNEIVCVGNSVSSSDGRAAETIVENRRLGFYGNNAFTVNGASKPSGPGWTETMAGTSWAHLAGTVAGADIGYFLPQATSVKALRESRSGAMKDINTTYGSSTRNTRHYLTLYLDHGTNPTSGTYSYVLLPGLSSSSVAAYAASPDITVVQNNSTATAVKENRLGITAANFWKDSSNFVAGISSDHKASAIFRNDGNVLDIGVSDPTQTNMAGINVELSTAVTAILSLDAGVSILQTSPLKLWFNTSNTYGASLRARFAITSVQTNSLLPVADTYVQNGTASANNFGDASTLAVKSGGTTLTRETYMRFDLSSVPGVIVDANLRLITRSFDETIYHALAVVPSNSWFESGVDGINWNTKPASDAASTVWKVLGNNQTSTVPMTALTQEAHAGDGKLSFRIFSTGTNSTGPATGGGFVSYGSKENSAANRPQLLVTFIRTPPTVRLSSTADGTALDAPAVVTLTAEAQDADGIVSQVEFYCGTMNLGQVLNPPYTVTLPNLAAGDLIFTAVATDNTGLRATSGPVNVSVYVPEPAGRGTGLVGEYYAGLDLKNLAFTRTDPTVNFFWGSATNPVANEHFSVRWLGKLQVRHAGLHQFHADTDDGVRLWVDDHLIIDNWNSHPPYEIEETGSISLVPGRYYNVVIEYFDNTSTAVARFYWTQPGGVKEIIPPSQLYPADSGLRATYFYDTSLSTKALTRIDDAVNFVWNTNSPEPTSLIGTYGARWTGKVKANAAGQYQFFTASDDAVRLWVNGQLIINNWAPHALVEDAGVITLSSAGQFYDVMMEFFNMAGAGTAILSWQPPGEPKQVIPTSNLTPYQNNNPPTLAFVTNQIAARNALLMFSAIGTDSDAGQSLTYSLDGGAPVGAAVHPITGVFSWTPSNSQPFGPCNVTLRVTDNGSPQMTDAQTFTITMLTNPPLAFVRAGDAVTLTWPQSAGGVQLYSATNLTPPVAWVAVTATAVLSNSQWSVQIPAITNGTYFFQLQTP